MFTILHLRSNVKEINFIIHDMSVSYLYLILFLNVFFGTTLGPQHIILLPGVLISYDAHYKIMRVIYETIFTNECDSTNKFR